MIENGILFVRTALIQLLSVKVYFGFPNKRFIWNKHLNFWKFVYVINRLNSLLVHTIMSNCHMPLQFEKKIRKPLTWMKLQNSKSCHVTCSWHLKPKAQILQFTKLKCSIQARGVPESLLKTLVNIVSFLLYYFTNILSPVCSFQSLKKTFCSTLNSWIGESVNWWFGFFYVTNWL